MARTLAELTLRLSQDLSALDAACSREMDTIERARDAALMEIGSAQQALRRYNQGLAAAKASQMKATQEANAIRDKEIHTAEDKRRQSVALAERKYRQLKNQAYQSLEQETRKAKAKWQAALENVRRQPLSEQRALRRAAEKAYEEAVEAAREAYHNAVDQARLGLQSALQDVLAEERMAFEKANRMAERMITGAAVAYERAVAQEEASLRSELAADPDARGVLESHDQKMAEVRRTCERKKESLFKKFSEDRKKLKR